MQYCTHVIYYTHNLFQIKALWTFSRVDQVAVFLSPLSECVKSIDCYLSQAWPLLTEIELWMGNCIKYDIYHGVEYSQEGPWRRAW